MTGEGERQEKGVGDGREAEVASPEDGQRKRGRGKSKRNLKT